MLFLYAQRLLASISLTFYLFAYETIVLASILRKSLINVLPTISGQPPSDPKSERDIVTWSMSNFAIPFLNLIPVITLVLADGDVCDTKRTVV